MADLSRKRRNIAIGLLVTSNSLLVLIVVFVVVCIYGLIDTILHPVMLKGLGPLLGLWIVAPFLCLFALLICIASWITGRANKSIVRFNMVSLILIVTTGVTSITSLWWTPHVVAHLRYRAATVFSTTQKTPPLEEIRRALNFDYPNHSNRMAMSIADRYEDSPSRDLVFVVMLKVLMGQKPTDEQSINYILSKKPNLNISVSYYDHPIEWAIESGNIDQVRLLINAGFDPNKCFISTSGSPLALSNAIQKNRYDIVELLVERGFDWVTDGQLEYGGPMYSAIRQNDKQLVKVLLAAGPQDLTQLPPDLRKRLGFLLFLHGDQEIQRMFFDRGFPPETVKGYEAPNDVDRNRARKSNPKPD